MKIRQPTGNLITSVKYIAPSEFEDVYEQARRIPPRRDCPWLYQLPEEIRRAKNLNNREPLNREPNNLCSYTFFLTKKSLPGDKKRGGLSWN